MNYATLNTIMFLESIFLENKCRYKYNIILNDKMVISSMLENIASDPFFRKVSEKFYRIYRIDKKLIQCLICERRCVLADGLMGFCWNYVNINGKLYNLAYGMISALEPRPIEIKPLFHYYPNSIALTFSGWGCNFRCPWCQNYHLSWSKPLVEASLIIEPDKLIEYAVKTDVHGLCASFNEPTIQPEYLVDIGLASRGKNLYLTVVTNGYMSLNTLKSLLEAGYTGFSIDIKGCPETYRKYLSADPTIVFRNAKYILDNGGHVEMVYLMVTKANDWGECIEWIIDNHIKYLDEDTPLHINKYYPAFKYREEPTSFSKLLSAYNKARKAGIKYVYIGNIIQEEYQDTICPKCGKKLIIRRNYRVVSWNLTPDYRCPRCGYRIRIFGRYIS